MNLVIERPRHFDPDVISDDGRIDAKKLADALDITLTQLAKIINTKPKTLSESPTSRKIQEPASKLLGMMDDVADYLQEKRFAIYWLHTPQRELGDRTALDWLLEGKLDEIRDHVSRIVDRQPD
jgi:hypothetical protein